jgi:hypothetical protein
MSNVASSDIHRNTVCKHYVPVLAGFAKDGTMTPIAIRWNRKTIIPVDEVIDSKPYAAERGYTQTRYRIRIGQKETYLFLERQSNPRNPDDLETLRWWLYTYDSDRAIPRVQSA